MKKHFSGGKKNYFDEQIFLYPTCVQTLVVNGKSTVKC